METKKNARWGKFGGLRDVPRLEELAQILGRPTEVGTDPNPPKYQAGKFQIWMTEEGVWIHACLLRQWKRREFYRWFADTQVSRPAWN